MTKLRTCAALAALCLSVASTNLVADSAVIAIDAARPGPAINPRLYGIFLEEINHGVDGGSMPN